MTILENTQQSKPNIFLDGKNILQRDTTPTATNTLAPRASASSGNSSTTIIVVGAAIIAIGAAVYIGRLLYKKRSKNDLENSIEVISMEMERPPKKTAADHLQEIKGMTQKALQPLKLGNLSTFSLVDTKEKESNTLVPKLQAESRPSTSDASGNSSIRNTKSHKKIPSPPPPSPLKSQHNDIDDIETEPIRLSLLDALLLDSLIPTHKTSSSSLSSVNPTSKPSRRSIVANSRIISQSLPSRLSSQASRDRLNPRKSKQSLPKYVITSKEKDEPIQNIDDISNSS